MTGLPGPPGDSSFSGLQGDVGNPGKYFLCIIKTTLLPTVFAGSEFFSIGFCVK